MSSAHRHELVVCNTSPVRHFAEIGRADLLSHMVGGTIRFPRQVLDLDEDAFGPARLVSEIGDAERSWSREGRSPRASMGRQAHALGRGSQLAALRQRVDLDVLDLEGEELTLYAELASAAFAKSLQIGRLGKGEAAVMAITIARSGTAVIDDFAARGALSHRSPGTPVKTCRDLLRATVHEGQLDREDAEQVYADLLDNGWRGPPELWAA